MGLREEALAAYEKRVVDARERARKQEEADLVAERRHLAWNALQFFGRLAKVVPSRETPVADQLREIGVKTPFTLEKDCLLWEGLRFYRRSNSMELREPCPDCDGTLYSDPIEDLSDIGAWIAGEGRRWHDHYFEDDSTHPNAPKPYSGPAVQDHAEPTAADRLLAALADFINEERF